MHRSTRVLAVSLVAALASAQAAVQPATPDRSAQPPAKAEAPVPARIGDPYPFSTCPVSGGKLGSMGEPIIKLYEGREVRFCCKSCPPKFEKDLTKSLAALDDSIIKDQAPIYPLKTSIISGKGLPEKPIEVVYGNRLVRLGAESERADFLNDPKKHLTELDKAVVEAQRGDYPLKECPVSGEELGSMGKPVDLVVAGRLLRLCCKSCVTDVLANPSKFVTSGGVKPKLE